MCKKPKPELRLQYKTSGIKRPEIQLKTGWNGNVFRPCLEAANIGAWQICSSRELHHGSAKKEKVTVLIILSSCVEGGPVSGAWDDGLGVCAGRILLLNDSVCCYDSFYIDMFLKACERMSASHKPFLPLQIQPNRTATEMDLLQDGVGGKERFRTTELLNDFWNAQVHLQWGLWEHSPPLSSALLIGGTGYAPSHMS